MEAERLSSLYILGEQSVLPGHDIVVVCSFAEPIDPSRLYPAFERFIHARPLFRQRLVLSTREHVWEEIPEAELQILLEKEALRMPELLKRSDIDSETGANSTQLPLRISRLAPDKLAFTFDHSLLTGLATYYWIDDWLQFLSHPERGVPPLPPHPPGKDPGAALKKIRGYGACVAYLLGLVLFLRPSRLHELAQFAGGRTLSHAQFASRTREFTSEESALLLQTAKRSAVSFSEYFLTNLAQALFEAKPGSKRAAISVPYDLGPVTPGFSRSLPGNFTGSMVLTLEREKNLINQIQRHMGRLRQHLRFWLSRFFASLLHDERKVLQSFRTDARLSPMQKNVFSRLSCAASNLGKVTLRPSLPPVTRLSGCGKTQTIYIGLVIFEDKITLECMIAEDLYSTAEVFPLFDSLCEKLLKPVF